LSLFMTLDCPHCFARTASFSIRSVHLLSSKNIQNIYSNEIEVHGVCRSCNHSVVAGFSYVTGYQFRADHLRGDITKGFSGSAIGGLDLRAKKIWQAPEIPKSELPDHLPENVVRPLIEAETAFSHGLWGAAAASYRKTVERAVTPLIDGDTNRKELGKKLGMLEKQGTLPEAMLEWIRVVKDQGNFALHDNDYDFDAKDQIEPAREFTITLLTYLFTLPEKVRLARALPEPEQDATAPEGA